MRVIAKSAILEFIRKHPKSESSMLGWYAVMSKVLPQNFAELRDVFGSVDVVNNLYVFNIAGNNYRLIAAIHFNRQKVFIRHVLTHPEYDKGEWKK